ncbi:MAG: serine hydrolase [Phycisphaerae bacterium]|jgi:predicted metalloprotease with PDZ domain/CubicO group peptidase (beta-lactamase class C family)
MIRAVRMAGMAAGLLVCATAVAGESLAPIMLEVDASEAPRRIFHVRLVLPVRPGPLTLVYPKWIPGKHSPAGPVRNLASLTFTAAGRSLAWRRDNVDLYAFHIEVPEGASRLEARFDYLALADDASPRLTTAGTAHLAAVGWDTLVLYPRGQNPDRLIYQARLRLPEGWRYGTALRVESADGGTVAFRPVALTELMDSPLIAGRYFRKVELAPGLDPPHALLMTAPSPAALEIPPEKIDAYTRLVTEGLALFGAPHYRRYNFLLTLCDELGHGGLEHHESSDNRSSERAFLDETRFEAMAGLLPHEFVHSWNGKHRRPAGLVTADYQEPMKDDLLWVYEGLTSYLGMVLTARSGLLTPEQSRRHLAHLAADLDHTPGRGWRPLADTAVATASSIALPRQWGSLLRSRDYYPEGVLIWLEADVTIRRKSDGRKSLDDFCARFFGGQAGPPSVKAYELDDVIALLNELAPHDWAGFFHDRVHQTGARAPLGGIEAGGWKLTFTDAPSATFKAEEQKRRVSDLGYSIGLRVGDEGVISDVVPGLPADQAGLAPGMKLVAVNGRKYSTDQLRAAVRAGKDSEAPIEIIAQNGDFFASYRLDYHGGPRFPELTRDESSPDLLSEILKPRLPKPGTPADAVDAVIEEEMGEQNVPGLSLAVVKKGEVVKARGYGLANLEWKAPATPQTVYQIQSITKTFTATAIMMLVEEGRIDLDARVSRYLEGTPESWKDITVRHLLAHTSGIKDFINEPTASLRIDVTEEEVFKATVPRPLNFTPGEKYAYSNTNYHLLAMMIRKLTGKFYGDFLAERIFEPLGMKDTAIINWSAIIPNRAAGYRAGRFGGLRNGEFIAPSILGYGGGGIRSTVLDLARYDAALYTERLVKKATLEQMWTPARFNDGRPSGYGLGWGISTVDGHRCLSHTGGHATGFSTILQRYVDDGVTIILFTNRQGVDTGRIARRVAALYVPGLSAPAPASVPASRPASRPGRRPPPLPK